MSPAAATRTEQISPHGGQLRPLLLDAEAREQELARARELPRLSLGSREASDLVLMASGAFSPLQGFMRREDYRQVLDHLRLKSGTLWPMPVTLSLSAGEAAALKEMQPVALDDRETGQLMATMTVEDLYPYNREEEATQVFGTGDRRHPGVAAIYAQKEMYAGGTVTALSEGSYAREFPEYARPAETREIFLRRGWRTVAAFQTRNPMHRSHEHLTKTALELCDGLLVHPVVGRLKAGDLDSEIRLRCCRALLDTYYPKERVVLKVYPLEMRYAGPREAVLHAIIRQNFGCTHLIVGRDHAGVGSYYGPYDAQLIFDQLPAGSLQIKPLKLDSCFWCYRCGGMASNKTCPHRDAERCLISGTELRRMLARGERPPAEFSRPEVIEILEEHYRGPKRPGS